MGPARRPMNFGSQSQRFGSSEFGGSFGGPRRTMGAAGAGAGTFGFQRFASPMPSGFVDAGSQFGGQGGFQGQGSSFMGQGSVRQFRFGPQGSQVQTFRLPPQQGQFTTFRFGSQPGQFSGGSVRTLGSGSLQGQGQSGTGFSTQTFGQTGGSTAGSQGGTGFSTQTFGQAGGSSSSGFLTPVGV